MHADGLNLNLNPQEGGAPILPKSGLMVRATRMFWSQFPLFLGIAAVVPLSLLMVFAYTYYTIYPIPEGPIDLRSNWEQMDTSLKLGFGALILFSLWLNVRVPPATILAAAELHQGRRIGVLRALWKVRGKGTRIFWLLMTVGLLLLPVGVIGTIIVAPRIPVAVLENRGIADSFRNKLVGSRNDWLAPSLIYILIIFALGFSLPYIFQLLPGMNLVWVRVLLMPAFLLSIMLAMQWWVISLTLHYYDVQPEKGADTP